MLKGHFQELQGPFFLKRNACTWTMKFLLRGMGELNSMPDKKLLYKLPMWLGDALGQRMRRNPSLMLDRQIFRNQNVNAVWFPIDMIVNPFKFEVQLVRRKRGDAQHAEAPRVADCRYHVTAVTECDQRKINSYSGF